MLESAAKLIALSMIQIRAEAIRGLTKSISVAPIFCSPDFGAALNTLDFFLNDIIFSISY